MNWAGALFGVAAALAVAGAAAGALAASRRLAVLALIPAMLGVAGMCLALGYDFLGLVVAAVLAGGVPAAALLADPVAREEDGAPRRRDAAVAVLAGTATAIAALYLMFRTEWLPAAGPRQNEAVWLGWSLLSTDLAVFLMTSFLLAAAGTGAVVLLRARRQGRGRS